MRCWKCGSPLRYEPGRVVCVMCGAEVFRRASTRDHALQLHMDFQLRGHGLDAPDVVTFGEYLEFVGALHEPGVTDVCEAYGS